MRVVIVDGDISYPATSGKSLRTLNLMLPLARRHHVTYLARGDARSGEARQAATFLADHGATPVFVDHPVARKSGPLFHARLAANLLSALPYSVTSHTSPRGREAVRQYARQHPVDLWHFEALPYPAALDGPGPIRTVPSTHNVA